MHAYVCAWVLLISLDVPSPSDEEVPVHKAVVEMNDQMKQVDSLIPRFERDPGNEAIAIYFETPTTKIMTLIDSSGQSKHSSTCNTSLQLSPSPVA